MEINKLNSPVQEYINTINISDKIDIVTFIRNLLSYNPNLEIDFLITIVKELITKGYVFVIPGVKLTNSNIHKKLSSQSEKKVSRLYDYIQALTLIENKEPIISLNISEPIDLYSLIRNMFTLNPDLKADIFKKVISGLEVIGYEFKTLGIKIKANGGILSQQEEKLVCKLFNFILALKLTESENYVSTLNVSEALDIDNFINNLFLLNPNIDFESLFNLINGLMISGYTFNLSGFKITIDIKPGELEQKVRNKYNYFHELTLIENGDYINVDDNLENLFFRELQLYPVMEKVEFEALLKKVLAGDEEAEKRFKVYNVRLVMKIARKHLDKGLEFQDLVIEGTFGLFEAINTYDPSRNCKFSVYASLLISQEMRRAIADNKDVDVPPDTRDKLFKLAEAEQEFYEKYDRKPTIKELSKILNVPKSDIENYKILLDLYNRNYKSLSDPLAEGLFVEDTIADRRDRIEESLHDMVLEEATQHLFSCLSSEEQELLNYLFGLNEYPELETQELCDKFGISRTVLSSRERRILNKLNLFGRQGGIDNLDF